jgi:hypothetical protein
MSGCEIHKTTYKRPGHEIYLTKPATGNIRDAIFRAKSGRKNSDVFLSVWKILGLSLNLAGKSVKENRPTAEKQGVTFPSTRKYGVICKW